MYAAGDAGDAYYLDGNQVDQTTYAERLGAYGSQARLFLAAGASATGSDTYLMPEAVAQEAKDTATQLGSLAGDLLDAAGA